jgi:phosphoribosyl 1,2-cyclic phosphodiesterase
MPALRLCNLGSGSGGNATVVQLGDAALLVDAGFAPRTTAARLKQAGLTLADLRAVFVTHFDRDHFKPRWLGVMRDLGVALHCHRWHLPELRQMTGAAALEQAGLVRCFDDGEPFDALPGLHVSTTRCQHDRQGTIAYRFDAAAGAIGFATDLGHCPDALVHHFANVDLLCIEANYDARMTTQSSRPSFVNRRNLSDSGHLSNEQALAAVQAIAAASSAGPPARVVLLHRSSQCNHPTKVSRCFESDPLLRRRFTLTEQRRRTRWLQITPRRQMLRAQLPLLAS